MVKDSSGDQQEEIKMKTRNSGHASGTAGATQGKFSNLIAYILLGLFVLLTIIFVVGLLKFKQISREIKDLRDDVSMQLLGMKMEVSKEITNGHQQILNGQVQMNSKIAQLSADEEQTRMELRQGQSLMANDIVKLADQTRRSHNDFKNQLADMEDNCRPQFECPNQWILFGQKCYHVSGTVEDWPSSQKFCSSKMSNLAVIDSAEEQGFLKQKIKSTQHWIGLNESNIAGNWSWVDGTDYASTLKFWGTGEPRDLGSYEACAGMRSDGKWSVFSCSQRLNFICERPVTCHFK
ncbi:C-type lectin domain family 4 member E-like isoform X2 [Carcharodon carcharias]|uniref:C-type lectin domain family 4 member E-like isoform X2 n=1 Tax=Carcharodon carcharias TaxID=13397 RepID=UPI001B7D9108|nr:C-type lectin domain family 4 member E-like isoform X2 [Carcharodon carcharias]XP_041033048.1 C-type lectin domain family 4 member E-like isoform X2 [Carcharodon carcharias]